MSDWIRLDPQRIAATGREQRKDRGIEVSVSLSPYDVPEAVRGYFDSKLDRFVIEFSYIGNEAWELHRQDDQIQLRIGKTSGRIYGLEIEVSSLRDRAVELEMRLPKMLSKAIDHELSDAQSRKFSASNYKIAKDVIYSERLPLFASLPSVLR